MKKIFLSLFKNKTRLFSEQFAYLSDIDVFFKNYVQSQLYFIHVFFSPRCGYVKFRRPLFQIFRMQFQKFFQQFEIAVKRKPFVKPRKK